MSDNMNKNDNLNNMGNIPDIMQDVQGESKPGEGFEYYYNEGHAEQNVNLEGFESTQAWSAPEPNLEWQAGLNSEPGVSGWTQNENANLTPPPMPEQPQAQYQQAQPQYQYQQPNAQNSFGQQTPYTFNQQPSDPRFAGDPNAATHNLALTTLILGIASCVLLTLTFFSDAGAFSWLGLIAGIVGIVMGNKAKKAGNTESIRTVGFILSIVGVAVFAFLLVLGIIALMILGSNLAAFY